jgi:hypothetical protein
LAILGRAAIVVRRGQALRLELERGRELSITVDDAGTAAELINGLLARNASGASGEATAVART